VDRLFNSSHEYDGWRQDWVAPWQSVNDHFDSQVK